MRRKALKFATSFLKGYIDLSNIERYKNCLVRMRRSTWTEAFELVTPLRIRETDKPVCSSYVRMDLLLQGVRYIIEGFQLSALATSVLSISALERLKLQFLRVFQLRIDALSYEALFVLSAVVLLACPFMYYGFMLLFGECCDEGLDVVLGTLGRLCRYYFSGTAGLTKT